MKAKKSLGQNFLKCAWALRAIVEASGVGPQDTVLEIGPGTGALTEKLLERGSVVIAVEKDDRLISYLQEKFEKELKSGQFTLIHGDILDETMRSGMELPEKYAVVANIPYYITGQFMRVMLESEKQPSQMIIMLQKEVTQRIVATDGKESILSISVKAYGKPKRVIDVPKHCFSPAPEIDSAVLSVKDISKDFFNDITEEKFFEVMKAGFAQKRKQLAGNLATYFDKNTEEVKSLLAHVGIMTNARAETLTIEEWKKVVRLF